MKNIVFIGMPGAGKSTIGVVIAKIFGYDFVDSDLLIQNQEGDILEHLIEKHGIEGFLQIENQVNRDINVKKTVISTGGSVCYCDEALKHMSEHGVIVYIKTDYESLHQRLGDLHQRGVVIRNGSTLWIYIMKERLFMKSMQMSLQMSADVGLKRPLIR